MDQTGTSLSALLPSGGNRIGRQCGFESAYMEQHFKILSRAGSRLVKCTSHFGTSHLISVLRNHWFHVGRPELAPGQTWIDFWVIAGEATPPAEIHREQYPAVHITAISREQTDSPYSALL